MISVSPETWSREDTSSSKVYRPLITQPPSFTARFINTGWAFGRRQQGEAADMSADELAAAGISQLPAGINKLPAAEKCLKYRWKFIVE